MEGKGYNSREEYDAANLELVGDYNKLGQEIADFKASGFLFKPEETDCSRVKHDYTPKKGEIVIAYLDLSDPEFMLPHDLSQAQKAALLGGQRVVMNACKTRASKRRDLHNQALKNYVKLK